MKFRIELEYSHFTTDGDDFNEGDRFISLHYEQTDDSFGGAILVKLAKKQWIA